MKNIVLLDSGTTIDEIKSIPVRSLTLQHLPAINGFCSDGNFGSHDVPTLFPDKKALFNPLRHLKLISISRIMLLVITALSNGMAPLLNLETMEILDCNDLQYLFAIAKKEKKDHKAHENYGGLLPDLRQLHLRNLGKLRSIVGLNHPEGILGFKMLNQLTIWSCNKLRYVLPLYVLKNLQQLENIEISDCEILERIFGDEDDTQMRKSDIIVHQLTKESLGMIDRPLLTSVKVIECNTWANYEDPEINIIHLFRLTDELSRLEELKIKDSEELRKYMEMELQSSSFRKLKILEALQCEQELTKFLSIILLRRSHELEELIIENCKLLELVFDLEDLASDTLGRLFCNLDDLQLLSLPKLTKFNSGHCNLTIPNLQSLRIEKCPEFNAFTTGFSSNQTTNEMMDSCLKLQTLKLVGSKNFEEIWQGKVSNINITDCELKEVEVDSFSRLRYIFPSILENLPMLSSFSPEIFEFPKLYKARIVNCPAIKTFSREVLAKASNFIEKDFSSESPLFGHGKRRLPPQLEELELSDLPKMQLWNKEPQIPVFEKLTSLKIIGCGSIEKLFSVSVAKHLVLLKSLTVYKCESMLQVLHGEGLLYPGFVKLETLVLKHLPRLTCFWEVDFAVAFLELKMVRMEDVPNMDTFTRPVSPSCPKLKEVYVTYVNKYWRGDLNETIKETSKEVWKADQSSPGNSLDRYKDAAESSSQGMKRTSWSFEEVETELH
ncbi:hypothetical protein K1719_032912 [Acacia pycnantha]|nr:hypothetical protein K1719_032912 [Acacia pycnantha]